MTPLDVRLVQDMVTVATLAPFVLAGLKIFLSRLPIFAPASPDRDVALNVVLYLINLILLAGVLYSQDALDLHYWLPIMLAAAGQHTISALGYQAMKLTIPSVQAAKAKANNVVTQPSDGALYTSSFAVPLQLPPDVSMDDATVATVGAAAPQ